MQPLSLLRVAIIHLGSDSPTVVARQVGWVRTAQPSILSNAAPWWEPFRRRDEPVAPYLMSAVTRSTRAGSMAAASRSPGRAWVDAVRTTMTMMRIAMRSWS
jgi:hypothetical protein